MIDYAEDDDWPEERPRYRKGTVIARRYRLSHVLGRGSYGEVWEAHDVVTERRVAVKLLSQDGEQVHARAQLEVAALRQGLPGVAELLDDGIEDDGQAFLVLELVEGSPFPGADPPRPWAEIAPVFVALLETIARLHAVFVIHRDLKPTNVLVAHDKRVWLLDFGTAYRVIAGAEDSVEKREVLGTPAYMAPEQVRGQALSERTDIFALGVMLYEALAGRLPHQGETPGQLLRARLTTSPTPLLDVAPDVPPNVARLVGRMLAVDPKDRPASAIEVLATLRGERAIVETEFLWLGSREGFDQALRAVRERRSVDIAGPRGSGRTRWLRGIEQIVSDQRRVRWLVAPSGGERETRPFESLRAFLIGPDELPDRLAFVTQGDAEARVRAALAEGDVFLADDAARLDPSTQAVLTRARESGSVVRAFEPAEDASGAAVRIAPLEEADLRALIAGPERLLHLREDAARLLHQRTAGVPASVVREVDSWLALGVARRSVSLLTVSRDGLDRLAAGVLAPAPPPEGKARGIEAQRRAAHAAAAATLDAGTTGRLLHLVLAGTRTDAARVAIAREAVVLASRLVGVGRLGAAVASIETGLRTVRDLGPEAAAEKADLFGLWLEAALEEGTPRAVDPLLYALYRAGSWPGAQAVESMARALKIEDFASARAIDVARLTPPQSDPRLERLRVCTLLNAGRLLLDREAEERLLDELSVAADPEIAARIDFRRGRLRYQENRFLEAAALHERAGSAGSPLQRIAAKNAGAWAFMEAFELGRAHVLATEAQRLAIEHRHAGHEAAAAHTLRSIAYRRRVTQEPDMELVAAVQIVAARQRQGAVLLTEAAVAYRARHGEARALARRAHELFSMIDQPRGALLTRCLAAALGEPVPPEEVESLHHKALRIPGSGLGLQALALLAEAGLFVPSLIGADRLATLAAEVPPEHQDTPTDVLSVRECLDTFAGARSGA